jgi:N-acetyl-1-D-myo-inositol-2-amino-2-deoxy-alpha-D-glucopyranoside deacetylase
MAGVPENDRPGAFCRADLDAAAARLVELIHEERPAVMVAYDETGGYGHPDHVMSHDVAVHAFERADPAIRPRKLYFVRFPISWSRHFVRALRGLGIPAPGSAPAGADAGPEVQEIGVPDELVTTRIDVRAFIDTKLAALACHASQVPPHHFLRRVPRHMAEELWACEFYSRADLPQPSVAVRQTETDLFAALD